MERRVARAVDELRSYGRALIAAAELVPVGAPMVAPRRSLAYLRPAATLLTAAALTFGSVTLAAAADAAAPGDLLYPIDRSIENVAGWLGLGGDHTTERISEANLLLATGRPAEAIRTAAAALPDSDETVTEAILDAVAALPAGATVRRLDLHIAIGDLITAAHDASERGQVGNDVVAAAHRVAAVAQGGSGSSEERAVDRNDGPSGPSPQTPEGSSRSDAAPADDRGAAHA